MSNKGYTPPTKGALALTGYTDGIDVSSCQGPNTDYGKVRDAGFTFVAAKVSEGPSGQDPDRLINMQKARAAGLYVLAYAFCRLTGDAKTQVQNLWQSLGSVMVDRLVLDIEIGSAGSVQASCDWIEAAVDAAEKLSALPPVIYTGHGFTDTLQPNLGRNLTLANCPLWCAQYRSTQTAWAPGEEDAAKGPSLIAPWKAWTMWQYSGNNGYRVPGLPTDCDRNLFNGDADAFKKFVGRV